VLVTADNYVNTAKYGGYTDAESDPHQQPHR
jgi:hypothetical protein